MNPEVFVFFPPLHSLHGGRKWYNSDFQLPTTEVTGMQHYFWKVTGMHHPHFYLKHVMQQCFRALGLSSSLTSSSAQTLPPPKLQLSNLSYLCCKLWLIPNTTRSWFLVHPQTSWASFIKLDVKYSFWDSVIVARNVVFIEILVMKKLWPMSDSGFLNARLTNVNLNWWHSSHIIGVSSHTLLYDYM